MKSRTTLGGLATLVALLLPAFAVAAPYQVPSDGKLHVLPEGIAAVDPTNPAASAQAVPMDTAWTFGGQLVSPGDAAKKGLACLEDATATTRCYSSEASLTAAESVEPFSASVARFRGGKRSTRRHVHAAQHYYDPMLTWQYGGRGGWVLELNSQCSWYNLTGAYDNAASHLYTGNHTGYWSVGSGGTGAQVGGGPGTEANLTVGGNVIWDNILSSRYRYGC
jgi:hypothetical protein